MKTRSDGTTLISIYHFVCGAVNLLLLCVLAALPVFVGLAVRNAPDGPISTMMTGLTVLVVGGIILLVGIANLVVGVGLWRGREWARIGAIGLAVLRLINIPLGTVIGALIIWQLMREEAQEEFSS